MFQASLRQEFNPTFSSKELLNEVNDCCFVIRGHEISLLCCNITWIDRRRSPTKTNVHGVNV